MSSMSIQTKLEPFLGIRLLEFHFSLDPAGVDIWFREKPEPGKLYFGNIIDHWEKLFTNDKHKHFFYLEGERAGTQCPGFLTYWKTYSREV